MESKKVCTRAKSRSDEQKSDIRYCEADKAASQARFAVYVVIQQISQI